MKKIAKNIMKVLLVFYLINPAFAKNTLNNQNIEPTTINKNTCLEASPASKDNVNIDTLGNPLSYNFTLGQTKLINLSSIIITINNESDTGIYMISLHLNNIARDYNGFNINSYDGSICVYDVLKNELIDEIELNRKGRIYGSSHNKFYKYGDGIGFHLDLSKKTQYLIIPKISTKIVSTDSYTFLIEKKGFVK